MSIAYRTKTKKFQADKISTLVTPLHSEGYPKAYSTLT